MNFTFPNSSPLCLEPTVTTIAMDIDNVAEFKLSIECDYCATDPSNMTAQYFIFNPNATSSSPITVKWYEKNTESDSSLQHLIATKSNYLYQLIPWLLVKTRKNTNNVCQNVKSCINYIWKDTSSYIAVGSFVEVTNDSEIDMVHKEGVVVRHDEQEVQFDFEWELHKYYTKFKPLDLDIALNYHVTMQKRFIQQNIGKTKVIMMMKTFHIKSLLFDIVNTRLFACRT